MIMLLLVWHLSFEQTKTPLSEGASLMFKDTRSKLTDAEMNWFYKQLGFTTSNDKKQFMSGEFPVEIKPYVTDMNNDGIEEVFFSMKSEAVYGMVGESFSLYTKNNKGGFDLQDVGSGIAMVLNTKNLGYPDIAIGGPGFEFPAYRWDGKKYKYYKKIKDADLQNNKIKYSDLAEVNKMYVDKLK